ncbi:hypothetical protein HO133_008403 [Letharia lupina]|uniref:C2H2-type domain-containing protein n=1 Tax=Letharia lupina TaxID=560253 RepID=A0A8H6CP18_9LECA|nr:uncharacterized protein HO133_008403 [Letharia lupina]KAF6226962.1 hypothetical protein HO133_008403 [Letharia lupina]
MDVLEPWLAATIEGELGEALRHKEEGANKHPSIGQPRGLSYDDGSNLRITSTKKGPVVQITKFLTFDEPIQVTLSDSVIRVNASITNQASQRYAKKNKRNLTEGTVGGLIQLHDFEIVATHLGPRDKRLTLYVKEFKSIGSDGSGNFGVAPQAIESREGTKELLNKLADLRRHGPDAHSHQSAAASPIRSQPCTQTSDAGENQGSQIGFATQAPRSNASVVSKPKPSDPTTGINIGSISSANSVKSLPPPTKRKYGSSLATSLSPLQVQATPQRPSVNSTKALLGLLQHHKRTLPVPEVIPQPTTVHSLGYTAASIGPAVVEEENTASRDTTLAPGDDDVTRAPIESQKRKRQSPDKTPRKKAADSHRVHGIDQDCGSLGVDCDLDTKAGSRAAVTEASINALHSRSASSSISKTADSYPNAPLDLSDRSISKLTTSVSGQNTGQNRIRSKDVKIPKDQEALLNRADSWLPAEPGQREPTANIPISLLKKLNRKADLRAQRPTKIRNQENGSMTPSAVIDQTADSESDIPVSSGQWPLSPERDQLPPDSSFASAEYSDHSVQKTSSNPRSISSSRRQSHASSSSYSMPLGRPASISAERFSRGAGSPSMVSPGLSSPSVTSTSAGEEVHRFTCQAPGCDKSYKNSSGLKYHVDRYHDGNPATPSNSGSATPTVPGESTPMFPGLKSWSERDGGSGQKVVDKWANNESDSVQISASMSPLLGQNSDLLLDAQPAPVQSAATNPAETHAAKETFSPLLPASPTPESDLEMTVPLALNEETHSIAGSAPMQHFPSTASQPPDPFTQVKRTPYVNGRAHNESLPGSRILSSPLKANFNPLMNGTINDDTEFVSASVTSGPETSTAEAHGENGSSNNVEDQSIAKVAARLAEENNSQEMTNGILEKPNEMIAEVQQERRKAETAADKPDDASLIMTKSQSQSSRWNHPSVVSEANAEVQTVPEKSPTPEDNHIDPPPQLPTSDHATHVAPEMKRKVADSSFVSPNVAKRLKRFKVPSAFNFIERSEVPRDPSEGARQYRQDFLASRRSSESSTPTMSPTVSFITFPGPTSEDPLERSRPVRPEFLASRRSSETSTSTKSPNINLTALTGSIRADRRNAEVEKNVGNVTVQNQSIDTEIERQKKIEFEELSARSPMQEMKDAAPLPNGTTSMEPDGGGTKPGAQENPSFDPEADSLMSVAQNTDVEGPDAEQSLVMEASFYVSTDEAQRAQSVELDVSFQSPDQKTENDLANANDGADQNVESEIDLTVASHGQLVNTDEDARPVDSKSDTALKDLHPRADEIAEQGSNAPTPEVRLDQVAEHDTVTLESLYQQTSFRDNADTQVSGKTIPEPTSQQQPVTVDADIPMPDEIATERASHQRFEEVDTNSPMHHVSVNHDITPLKFIAHTDEPMKQTTSLSIAVPVFAAESDRDIQPHLSPAAVEPVVPLSTPMSDLEVKSVEEHQSAIQLPIQITKQEYSAPRNIFDIFKATYPSYPGDINHFAAICRKISQLVKANRMEHQSLWDDFIVRHKLEYPQYLRRCAEEAEDAVPYEEFYQTEIEAPQYQNRVINRRSLDEALAIVARKPSADRVHVEPMKEDELRVELVEHIFTSKTDPAIEKMHYEYAPANDDRPLELVGTKSAPKPASSDETQRKPSESRVIIDLTADDPPDEQAKRTKQGEILPQSSVPHLVNGVSGAPRPLQYRRDSSGSLQQVPYTPPTTRGSYKPPLPQSIRSPLVPATTSIQNTTKSNRRSLLWKESDHDVHQSSPNATTTNSPERLPASELREVHVGGFSNARLPLSAKSTPKDAKQNQGLLNTCHRVIQSNWGIRAYELLELEYFRGQVFSETMIELLAEIASKVNVREARNRIKDAIDTRVRDNAWRGADHPSQDRKILRSDLEAVRGVVETSSMSTTSPFSPPHTNAAAEKQDEGTPSKWWDDESSPYRSFVRAYTSIRQGNGNSFAKANRAEPADAEKVYKAASSGVQPKKIDIMRWNL